MRKDTVIGVFDSGLGGLTVVKELIKALPRENIIYFGDTARVPYGNKSKKTVTRFSVENVEFLKRFKVKLIVVACNTSCSLSLNYLKKKYSLPLIGVIEPAVKKALELSRNKKIGVIGTASTIRSGTYERKLKKGNSGLKIYTKSCPLFVPLAEEGWVKNKITYDVAREYLRPLKTKGVDTLILGCTHYPLLAGTIADVMGRRVNLINSAREVAREAKATLDKKGMLAVGRKGRQQFYVSDESPQFEKIAGRFLGRKINCLRSLSNV